MNSPGTLNYFKILLHRSNVNGKVKGQFRPHHDLLMVTGEAMNILKWTIWKATQKMIWHDNNWWENRLKEQLLDHITKFMDYYGYCKAHTEQSEPKDLQTQQRYRLLNVNNNIALVPCITENI